MATLVERHSRFCMLVKVPGKDTATVVAASVYDLSREDPVELDEECSKKNYRAQIRSKTKSDQGIGPMHEA